MKQDFNLKQPNTLNVEEEYFCAVGQEDFTDKDGLPRVEDMSNKVMAKRVYLSSSKQVKFYVRMGFDQKLYNPKNSLNASKNYTELNRNSESTKFKLVNELAFLYYTKYLATNNNIWLVKAEREVV